MDTTNDEHKYYQNVWAQFSHCDNNTMALCKRCKKKITCKGSSTTGLHRHLQGRHGMVKKSFGFGTTENLVSNVKRIMLSNDYDALSKFVVQTQRSSQSLEEIVSRLAALDNLPIKTIANCQFIRHSLTLQGHNLPKQSTSIMNLIYKYCEKVRVEIKGKIIEMKANNQKFSQSIDEWTSLCNRRYLNVHIYYESGEFKNLGLVRIHGSCPAEKMIELVNQKLDSFQINFEKDVVGTTSDGASVMVKFGSLSPSALQLCYNHAIHLAVLRVFYCKTESTQGNLPSYYHDDDESETDGQYDEFSDTEDEFSYFWHITDLHFDSSYTTKGDILKNCWNVGLQSSSQNRFPGRFGDYHCDSPWSLLESATQTMKSRQGDNVEFVLWTGDGLSHSSRRLIEKSRLEHLRNITELLGRTFPSQFVFPVLGHEDGQNLDFHRLGDLWRHWLPTEALQTFERGGYYTIEQTKSRLRIIVLNTNFMKHDGKHSVHSAAVRQRPAYGENSEYTNYYYQQQSQHQQQQQSQYPTSNRDNYHTGYSGYTGQGGQVSALSTAETHESQRQWEWLEDVLAKSNRNKETVYIVGHIPPGSDERQVSNGHTLFTEKNNLRYLRLVRKYSSIIQGQFFGHLHSDSFRIIYSDMGKPVSWMMIAPSVTPRKMNVGSNNPAMRLYKFETDTGQVLDYTQYYLDLSAANTLGEAVWQPEYNLTSHYYGLGEVTAVALHNLADRFTNAEDLLFAKYYRANTVRLQMHPCDSACALNHYCAITRVDYSEIRQCVETAASALASNQTNLLPNFLFISINLLILSTYHFNYLNLLKLINFYKKNNNIKFKAIKKIRRINLIQTQIKCQNLLLNFFYIIRNTILLLIFNLLEILTHNNTLIVNIFKIILSILNKNYIKLDSLLIKLKLKNLFRNIVLLNYKN